jgi:hypothetical protein
MELSVWEDIADLAGIDDAFGHRAMLGRAELKPVVPAPAPSPNDGFTQITDILKGGIYILLYQDQGGGP